MADAAERLQEISDQLRDGEQPPRVTVRAFLGWFGAQRRRYRIVKSIRDALDEAGLVTDPDFEGAYIDSEISFRPRPAQGTAELTLPKVVIEATGTVGDETDDGSVRSILISGSIPDPTYRIGKLRAANRIPLSVTPQATLREATTFMLINDFSQLPVMQGERTLKGVVSWQSIGSRLALNCGGDTVADYMDPAVEIAADVSLFSAISTIIGRQYVLIRGDENRITGIVTTTDLSLQFRQLAEPFLLLGEIENHVRRLIDGRFTPEEVTAVTDPGDTERNVETVADLTFGEYVRLLENPDKWTKLELNIDRAAFVRQLDRVREIRNDVMHFDPDPIGDDDLKILRDFVQFLQVLDVIGAVGRAPPPAVAAAERPARQVAVAAEAEAAWNREECERRTPDGG